MDSSAKFHILPPNPMTARSYSSCLSVSRDGQWLGYCVRNTVVLRSLVDLRTSKVFKGHKCQATAVCFHPEGKLAASADIQGNIMIWYIDDCAETKTWPNALGAKINGLEFTEDGQKLLFYGEGKKILARCINWEMGSNIGEFLNNTRTVLCGDLRRVKPYRAILGGEDFLTNYYEGIPFKFVHMNKEHTNFISALKFSPDSLKFISVGFDKKIIMYDATNGSVIGLIADDKTENSHKMTIIGFCWIDNERIATASLDKTIKIYNVNEKKVLMTLLPINDKLDVPHMMCNVQTNGKVLVGVTLNGQINFWNLESIEDKQLPHTVINGHQAPITKLAYAKNAKEVVSSDQNGKIIIWNEAGVERVISNEEENKVTAISICSDESTVFAGYRNGKIMGWNRTSGNVKFTLTDLSIDPIAIVPSRVNNENIYVLFYDMIVSIENGIVVKKVKLSNYEASALEVVEHLGQILIGDRRGKLHILDMNLDQKSVMDLHYGEFTIMRLSPDGKMVASGDNKKEIYVWDVETKKILVDRYGYHSAKIFDLNWSDDSNYLISGSLDCCVMLWQIDAKKRLKEYQNIDGDQINSVVFIKDHTEFICGGNACTIRDVTL